jgi:hypothetical protein
MSKSAKITRLWKRGRPNIISSPAIKGQGYMRVSPEAADDLAAQNFFAARGLLAARIPESKVSKTPDFRILRGAETVAFCELKSPQDVFPERVTTAISQGLAGVIQHGYVTRQYRCLERAAKGAAAQFNSINASRAVPNILMIVNHDTLSHENDFIEAVTGYVVELGKLVGLKDIEGTTVWAQ